MAEQQRPYRLITIDEIYCATCGYHINFHPHATCVYTNERDEE